MTGLTLYVVSALVSTLLVGLAVLLGFRRRARLVGPDDVLARVRAAEPDFVPDGPPLIDRTGAVALVKGQGGAVCIVRVLGEDITIRRFGPGEARVEVVGEGTRVSTADLGFPPVVLRP